MKYLRVEVERSEYSEIYLEVTDDYPDEGPETWPSKETVMKACLETCSDYEWESDRDCSTVSALSVEIIEEEDARQYKVFTVPVEASTQNELPFDKPTAGENS